jgi:hypothetical protein
VYGKRTSKEEVVKKGCPIETGGFGDDFRTFCSTPDLIEKLGPSPLAA